MELVKKYLFVILLAILTTACNGLFSGVYDEADEEGAVAAGQIVVDASNWGYWHYIDLPELAVCTAADPSFDGSSLVETIAIPTEEIDSVPGWTTGIYTYWYDVLGEGIHVSEYRSSYPTVEQPEPRSWTFAVHTNNVRTNGCQVARTSFDVIEDVPTAGEYFSTLDFEPDRWSENEVWTIREKMLQGIVGSQGIEVNPVLSNWLRMDMPPIPPAFIMDSNVYIILLPDGTRAAVQLVDYQNSAGVKHYLTINYKYPL